MKKLTTLLLAAGLVVSSYAGASAGEFVPNAQFINQYTFGDGGQGLTSEDDHFVPQFRLRLGFDYVASETLSGTFLFEVGVENYGSTGGSQLDNSIDGGEDKGYEIRLAYVDWMVPNTDVSVRMGFQPFAMPAFAFGSNLLDGRGAGITVAAPINENIDLTAAWIRVEHAEGDGNGHHNDYDAFALIADFNYDGFRVAPYAMYAMKGKETGLNMYNNLGRYQYGTLANGTPAYWQPAAGSLEMDAWIVGASFELSMFDPFMFALDAYYSSADFEQPGADADMDGFYVGAAASYKTSNGIPALKGWYASGNDKSGVPTGANSPVFDLAQPVSLVGGFNATSIMFSNVVMDTDGYQGQANYTAAGTWGILLEWADFSFVEKLSHTARIAYIKGTNDDDSINTFMAGGNNLSYLTTDDDVIEVNFNSSYEIYKNFVATLELGWLTADFGRRGNQSIEQALGKDAEDDIFRSALSFKYTF